MPPNAYDGIYNLGVMEHFTEEEIKRILDEFHRVLKPGGRVVLFWPPAFGFTVGFLRALHWVLRKVWKRDVKLHPDELTHVRSKKQVQEYLKQSGFTLEEFYFCIRDLFTQAVIVGLKPAVVIEDSAQPLASQPVTTA